MTWRHWQASVIDCLHRSPGRDLTWFRREKIGKSTIIKMFQMVYNAQFNLDIGHNYCVQFNKCKTLLELFIPNLIGWEMLWFRVQPRVQFPNMAWAAPNFTAFKLLSHWKRQVTNVYYALEAWRKQRKDQIFPRDKPNSYKFRRDTQKGERNHPCKFEVFRNIPIDLRDLSPRPYGGEQWPTHPLSGLCVGHCFGGLASTCHALITY